MTHEEAAAWVGSLKPGDTVIWQYRGNVFPVAVKKVTPTGIVRTNGGHSFKLSYCGRVSSYGGYYGGEIVPVTDELLAAIDKQNTVNRAMRFMRNVREVPYEFAKDLLELCVRHGIDV